MALNRGNIGLIALVLGGLGAIAAASFVGSADRDLVVIEIFKFFLFTCAVGGAALIYTEVEKQRDKADEVKSSRLKFRAAVWEASHKVALSRRMMRSVSKEASNVIIVTELRAWLEHIENLNDAQLSIERLRRILEANPPEFLEKSSQLSSSLTGVDNYLRSVIFEIEDCDLGPDGTLSISSSGRLREFLFSSSPPTYVEEFSKLNKLLLSD